MNILIVEDELKTAKALAVMVKSIVVGVNVLASIQSVETAVRYLSDNEAPDIIFMDIQLADGLCFEIFKAVKVVSPVVFCTAYDEYAIEAFKTNGVDYILKPFSKETVGGAIEKVIGLKRFFTGGGLLGDAGLLDGSLDSAGLLADSLDGLAGLHGDAGLLDGSLDSAGLGGRLEEQLEKRSEKQPLGLQESQLLKLENLLTRVSERSGKKSFLVFKNNKYVIVPTENIACFYIRNETPTIITFDQLEYGITQSLDEVYQLLEPQQFFRANRQYLVSFKAVVEVEHYFSRKLFVRLKVVTEDKVLVGKEKVGQFLSWLENR